MAVLVIFIFFFPHAADKKNKYHGILFAFIIDLIHCYSLRL